MLDSLKFLPEYLKNQSPETGGGDLFVLVQKLAIAILIGLLVGLEREHSRSENEKIFAGIRTFPLVVIFGFLSALISSITSYWVFIAGLIVFGSLVTVSHVFSAKIGKRGATSEISVILVFLLGAMVYWNFIIIAAIVGVVVAMFLTLKIQLHKFAGKVSEQDIYATIKLAVITVIILPLLPDKTYGPFNILNPLLIWRMVIFISAISFVGYIFIKTIGQNKGIPITGLLGGLVSSTALTISLSKKSKEASELSHSFGIGIILASTVMYLRIFFIVLVLESSFIDSIWAFLLLLILSGLVTSYFFSKKNHVENSQTIEFKNPFELKSALMFGFLFGLVLFVTKGAEQYLGDGGIYLASGLAGLSSVDAIAISVTKFLSTGLSSKIGLAAIIISTITNNIVKACIATFLGTTELKRTVWKGMIILSAISLIYLLLLFLT